MNFDTTLSTARTRAEKQDVNINVNEELKALEDNYGPHFAKKKYEYENLLPNEGFYDSSEEMLSRREKYIQDCEAEIHALSTEVAMLSDEIEELKSNTTLDDFEKHLKGASWNLNRIATVLEQANSHNAFDSIVDQLRAKGSK